MLGWISPTPTHVCTVDSTIVPHWSGVQCELGGAMAKHGPHLSSDADPNAVIAVFGGDEEFVHDRVPLATLGLSETLTLGG